MDRLVFSCKQRLIIRQLVCPFSLSDRQAVDPGRRLADRQTVKCPGYGPDDRQINSQPGMNCSGRRRPDRQQAGQQSVRRRLFRHRLFRHRLLRHRLFGHRSDRQADDRQVNSQSGIDGFPWQTPKEVSQSEISEMV